MQNKPHKIPCELSLQALIHLKVCLTFYTLVLCAKYKKIKFQERNCFAVMKGEIINESRNHK